MKKLEKFKAELKKLKENSNGMYTRETIEKIKLIQYEIYKIQEWEKIIETAKNYCKDCPEINRPDIVEKGMED